MRSSSYMNWTPRKQICPLDRTGHPDQVPVVCISKHARICKPANERNGSDWLIRRYRDQARLIHARTNGTSRQGVWAGEGRSRFEGGME